MAKRVRQRPCPRAHRLLSPTELTDGTVSFDDLIVEEDRRRVWEEVQASLAGGARFGVQYSISRKDGEVRHVEDYDQEVFDEKSGTTMLEGVVHDVTERERAQEALLRAEKRYRTLDAP